MTVKKGVKENQSRILSFKQNSVKIGPKLSFFLFFFCGGGYPHRTEPVTGFRPFPLRKVVKKRSFYGQADRKGGGGGVNPYSQPDRKKTVFFDDFPYH